MAAIQRIRCWLCIALMLTCILNVLAHAAAEPPAADNEVDNSTASPQIHHKYLTPLAGTDIGLFVVIFVALFIASGAGVGGGVLVVPSLLIISQFTAIAAVALSNVTILASAVANLMFNLPRKSIVRRGPLIDWDLVLLFGPPTVAGSIAGSYVNMVIPAWVTKVCLFVLLLPMAWRMIDKARSLYRRETAAKAAAKALQAASYEPDDLTGVSAAELAPAGPTAATPGGSSSSTDGAAAIRESSSLKECSAAGSQGQQQPAETAGDVETGASAVSQQKAKVSCWRQPSHDQGQIDAGTCQEMRDRLASEQAQMVPPFQCGLLLLLLAVVAAASLLAGYRLTCGSWQYWLLVLSPLLVMVLVWAVARHHVLWKAAWRVRLDMTDASELRWDARTTTTYPAICISAGVIAGMLGLGGGLVLQPLLIVMNLNPAVAAASTQVTLLISSSTSAIVYAVNGSVPWDYGVVLVVLGFLATLLGQWLVSWLVRRLGRPSILVITLAVMFSAATFAAAAVVVLTLADLSQHPEKWVARKGVCPA